MRMNGKSTRLIDQAVQKLFELGEILVPTDSEIRDIITRTGRMFPDGTFVDPDQETGNRAQEYFRVRLLRRLQIEHRDQFVLKGSRIRLKDEYRPH